MELYSELKNNLFLALCQVIEEIAGGKSYAKDDLCRRLTAGDALHPVEYHETVDALVRELVPLFFTFDEKGIAQNIFSHTPIAVPTALELSWLKNVVDDETFSFLLSPPLRSKLKELLEGAAPLVPPGAWKRVQAGETRPLPALYAYLQTYCRALGERKQLRLRVAAPDGSAADKTVSPCRLVYDLQADSYQFVVWDEKSRQFLHIEPQDLLSLEKLSAPALPDVQEKYEEFLQKNKRTLRLRLTNDVNAPERCFLLFASYDKRASVDYSLKTYELEITYYEFERDDVIKKILSLGKDACVLAPDDVRSDVISALQDAYKRYL